MTHSDGLHFEIFRTYLAAEGFQGGVPIVEAFFRSEISGGSNPVIFAALFPDRSVQRHAEMAEEKEALFRKLALGALHPLPGLLAFTSHLRARGVSMVAVTNAPRENAEMMLRAIGLWEALGGERLVIGAECSRAKPHPEPYLEGLRRLGVAAENAVAFEDSPTGLQAAVAAGLATFGVMTSQEATLLRRAGAAETISDFNDPKLWAVFGAERPGAPAEG